MVTSKLSQKNIIYVNFAPYENAGNILNYLFDHYDYVFLFCFNFHALTHKKEPSLLKIYKKGILLHESWLYYLPTPQRLAFFLLPIRSLIILLQLLHHTAKLKKRYGTLQDYFTVNAFTAWCGNILKKLGLVEKTIFWVWDYYPPIHKSYITMFMRWMYWQFDIPATTKSTKVVFLNQKLLELREELGIHVPSKSVVEIGTKPLQKSPTRSMNTIKLVFLGVVKKTQGLDVLFDAAGSIHKKFPNIELHIIGSGPDEKYFQERSKHSNMRTHFYGYIENDKSVDKIIRQCHIGISLYTPSNDNISYFTDPSKIKRYISQAVPVITTNVVEFSKKIKYYQAGEVIPYSSEGLITSVTKIITFYPQYSSHALRLARKFKYDTLYKKLFK